MFEHVTLLLSFIYVIALTHLLSCTTSLILARHRVRFSPLLALWMVLALGILFNNWLSIWVLRSMEHWSTGEISLDFLMATIQYFTCSLVCIELQDGQEVDMNAWYDKQRVAFLSAFASLCALAMLTNYFHRNISGGQSASAWIAADAILLAVLLFIVAAILFRSRWLQWVTAFVLPSHDRHRSRLDLGLDQARPNPGHPEKVQASLRSGRDCRAENCGRRRATVAIVAGCYLRDLRGHCARAPETGRAERS